LPFQPLVDALGNFLAALLVQHVAQLPVHDEHDAGLRVLAVADAPGADLAGVAWRPLGLVAFRDPLRPTAAPAVAECRRAGIRVVMVTGDHAVTAQSVAREVGLDDGPVVTGEQLQGRTAAERDELLARASVVARVDPDVKLELVGVHRARGEVVAMTGDGVNDAPALRQADVGVAVVGGEATDVAREAAAVLVTDGDLGTIVAAVQEGRRIFANLRSTLAYLISGNLSEIMVVVGAFPLLAGLATPFLPIQLLWINLMTDGLPALALGVDHKPGRAGANPRGRANRLLDRQGLVAFGGRAVVLACVVLASGWFASSRGWSDPVIRSQLLLALLYAHLLLALVSRADGCALGSGWWRNGYLDAAIGGSAALQVLVFTSAAARRVLHIAALPRVGWLVALGAAVAAFVVIESARAFGRVRRVGWRSLRDVRP
jgi:magnesium-transporting ATPase (P-type)